MNLTINTTDLLREFIPELTTEKSWDALKPRVRLAEDQDLRKIIGPEMLKAFRTMAMAADETDQSGSPSLSPSGSPSGSASVDTAPVREEGLFLLRRAIAFLVAFDMAKTGDVFFTSTGLQTVGSDTNKSVYEYQKRDIMNDYAEKSDTAIDDLLAHMEQNKDHFEEWTGTAYYTQTRELIINNATQFSAAVNINNSRRTFMALRPYINDNEILYLVDTLGEELFNKLKDFVKDPASITDEGQRGKMQTLTSRYLVPAIANLAMADAINMLTMRFAGEFITFASWLGLSKSREDKASEERHKRTERFVTRGTAMMKQAVDYIARNADAFPDFPITERENTGSIQIENSPDKHHFLPGF